MSTNISKQKRSNLINKIKLIKIHIAKSKQDKNTGNLLTYLSELEKEINGKKYGLVFEEHEEEIDLKLKTHTPFLSEEKDLFIDNGGQMNFLIEGDNLPALKLLEKTHKGKIDLIYIDPPYNTGNKDFIYSDSVIDTNDGYRHSKWMSFIKRRLLVANNLLSSNGVIFISIDDNEQAQLKILCDSIFGENNFICPLIWVKKTGASDAAGIATITEYILVYAKQKVTRIENTIFSKNNNSYDINRYNKKDEFFDERGPYYLDNLDRGGLRYSDSLNFPIIAPDGKECYPNGRIKFANDGWTWKWGKKKIEWAIKNKFIEVVRSKNKECGWSVKYKNYLKVDNENEPMQRSAPHKNLIINVLNSDAAANIKELFGSQIFKYSKPTKLIKHILSLINDSKGFYLDFFAGSGTFGEAVLESNKQDGGNRKFILCTNNENNICKEITYERIKRVIAKENYQASLKYFKVGFVSIDEQLYYEYADQLLKHIRELVELENGINFEGNNKIKIILTDTELADFSENTIELEKCQKLYLGHDVLVSGIQEKLFKDYEIEINIIPDYYYKELES